ncbi:MAG: hypothetical protein ABI591_23760 [Kofleriaceae bacterium]
MSRFALCLLVVIAGCGGRCKDVESARAALAARTGAPDRRADVRITLPFAQLDRVFAEQLAAKPLTVPFDVPGLDGGWTATAAATELRLRPGPGMAIRFATRIAIRDGDRELTTIAAEIDVTPVVHRDELVIGFGPEDVVSVTPVLGDDAKAALGDAVARHLPDRLRGKLPKLLLDEAAAKLAGHLTGVAFEVLRRTLFVKLGEVATWRVKLPDAPIASHAIRSSPTALVVELLTNLPVRRGLGAATEHDVATVELSGSAAAELANWTLDRHYLPRWYDRDLHPRPDGELTPRFDFVADDAHPFKIHVLQERGGCSYFRVGVAATVGMTGDRVTATATDRDLETVSANPVLELAATVKFFLFGWVDQSKQVAAHTVLRLGDRTLATRVIDAALEHGELRFGLAFGP